MYQLSVPQPAGSRNEKSDTERDVSSIVFVTSSSPTALDEQFLDYEHYDLGQMRALLVELIVLLYDSEFLFFLPFHLHLCGGPSHQPSQVAIGNQSPSTFHLAQTIQQWTSVE